MQYHKDKESVRKRYASNPDKRVLIIPPNPIYTERRSLDRPLRVCAYCRVSTPGESQASSYELQRNYYEEYIKQHPNWVFAGVYADEGITGTNRRRRAKFNQMIQDCTDGKIDLILTKGVARFSRRVRDCIDVVEELKELDPPVGVYFETEQIHSLDPAHALILLVLAAYAESESRMKSESMLWSLERRFSEEIFLCPTQNLLGYEQKNGVMVIEREGAKTVRLIFSMFLAGYNCANIAGTLTSLGRQTGKGNVKWSSSSVRSILKNERYCGDIIAQKTFTKDFASHAVAQNRGQKSVYYRDDHHDGIVSREEYVRVLLLLESRYSARGMDANYTLTVVREGLLSGFIPVNRAFGGYRPAHYVQAVINAGAVWEEKETVIFDLPGYEVVRIQDLGHSNCVAVTIAKNSIAVNRECVARLQDAEYVEILIHPMEKLLAIRPCGEESPNAIRWRRTDQPPTALTVSCAAFCDVIYELMGWRKPWRCKVMAVCLMKNDERVLLFDLGDAEFLLKPEETTADMEAIMHKKRTTLHQPKWKDSFGVSLPAHAAACRWHRAMLFDDWQIDAPGLPVSGFDLQVAAPTVEDIQRQIDDMLEGGERE